MFVAFPYHALPCECRVENFKGREGETTDMRRKVRWQKKGCNFSQLAIGDEGRVVGLIRPKIFPLLDRNTKVTRTGHGILIHGH